MSLFRGFDEIAKVEDLDLRDFVGKIVGGIKVEAVLMLVLVFVVPENASGDTDGAVRLR